VKKTAEFDKVGLKQFISDWIGVFGNRPDHTITEIYNQIKLPERKTRCSAGHDFHMPYTFEIAPGGMLMIPTGVKCRMDENYVMLIFPRSSLGIKKHMSIANTVPVIDADYINADNEGHIFICVENRGQEVLTLKNGEAFAQAVFVEYATADGKEIEMERNGGIGSTGE